MFVIRGNINIQKTFGNRPGIGGSRKKYKNITKAGLLFKWSYSIRLGSQNEYVKCHNCVKTGHIHKVCCGHMKVVLLPQITSQIKELVTDDMEGASEMNDCSQLVVCISFRLEGDTSTKQVSSEYHAGVLKEGLSPLKGFEVTIHMEDSAKPCICKARTVP